METQSGSNKPGKSARGVLESPEFRRLVSRRWVVSVILSLCLFVIYYGYILLIGYNKALLSEKVGEHTPIGIPIGVGVIVLSWVLTVIYVVWANRSYDPAVKKLKDQIK
jgi:uncharacterized membrane protein (DUF485 family)